MSDKNTTLQQLDAEYQKLLQAIEGLDESQLTRVWFGEWSVKEIIGHVSGWEREMIGALKRLARGERPMPEGVDYSNADEWNGKFASAVAAIGVPTVLANWRQAHMNYVKAARSVPDDRYGERDGKPQTVNRLLESSGTAHYKQHTADVSEWRQREGI